MAPLHEVLGDTFVGLDHVGLAVTNLDVAIQQWTKLGLTHTHRETNTEQGVDEAMLDIPHGPQLQLLGALAADTAVGKFLATHGPGLQQVAFQVTDIDKASQRVTDAGLRVLYEIPRVGTHNSRINFIHPKDVGGMLVELVEHA
jgi:methylmalonyl-CoA/ethylmalonyl-CoA epimerase